MGIEARNRSLPGWFERIRTRQTVLPRFQRFEAWSHANVTQLFNTILQDLPAGALLVLEIGDHTPFSWRTVKGAPEQGERITEHLLDGQQRLTALWRGLYNNYEDRTYFLYMKPDEETGVPFYVDSIARWRKSGDTEDRPFWANQPAEQWIRRMIPLDLCAPGEQALLRYMDWAKAAISEQAERDRVQVQLVAVREKFAAFNLPYLSLPSTTPRETALDVFIKMNTSAAPLSIYDIVVAQVEASMGESLHDLVGQIKEAVPAIADYYPPENLTLYAGALLQDRQPSNATYLTPEFGKKLLGNWERFLTGVTRTVSFLEDERVFDFQRLPTDIVVPVLTALWADAPEYLDAGGMARSTLRKYLWRAFFSNRYEKSTGSRALVDFSELKAVIENASAKLPTIFDAAQHPLPPLQELMFAGWPRKKDRLARAILAISLRHGGHDLADGGTVSRANLARREYHHLFPDAHLKRQGFSDEKIYRSLNCAVVTWRTNRNISDKEPERYLAERRDGHELGESEIRSRLASHLIPYEELVAGDYDAFLNVRAEMVFSAMNKLCSPGASSGQGNNNQ